MFIVLAAALLAGVYGRFKGIGLWPLGVDEFYISRSVDNILRSGWPAFSCGGYYTRGLLYQYLVAGVRTFGAPAEFAGRLVAAVSSLATLPAAYLLGKRVHGPLVGWLTVVMLCVSMWEIEMARFARMYAPFQAVFVWYLIFFLRYTVDRHRGALGWLIALSVLGASIWEGGVLLGFANMVAVVLRHERGRLTGADCLRLAALLLLAGLLFLGTRDMRGFAPTPAGETAGTDGPVGLLHSAAAWLAPLHAHAGWAVAGLILPLVFLCGAAPWIWSHRGRWLTALGLGAVLAAAVAHCLTLSAALLVLLLLAGLIDWRELAGPSARFFWLALVSLSLFWITFELRFGGAAANTVVRPTAGSLPPRIDYLFGFPDVYDEIIRPWGRALPLLSIAIAVAFIGLFLRRMRYGTVFKAVPAQNASLSPSADAIAALQTLVIAIVLIVGAIPTNRIETRYTFFLYPALLALTVAALTMLLQMHRILGRLPLVVVGAIPLACFAGTEDFQPRQLAAVDSARVNFRIGMTPVVAAHYYPRNDMRAAGDWFATHIQPGDAVITGIPSLAQYYPQFDYFFLAKEDNRYEDYVCPDGRSERWTNHPVLYTVDALSPIVASGRRTYVTVYEDTERSVLNAARSHGWRVTRVWATDHGNTDILLIAAAPGGGSDH